MSRQRFRYFIKGYSYAPESYRVFKRFAGSELEIEIPLTSTEQSTMALYCYSKGFHQAVDYVKQLERKKLRQVKEYVVYGFWTKEDPKMYIYSLPFRCKSDAPIQERLQCKKEFKEYLRRNGGKVEFFTECILGANFQPEQIQKHFLTADFSRPLAVRFTV